jgi:hypothetical protein
MPYVAVVLQNLTQLKYITYCCPAQILLPDNTRDRHPCHDGIRNHNPYKRVAAEQCVRPRAHWNRQHCNARLINLCLTTIYKLLLICFLNRAFLIYAWKPTNAPIIHSTYYLYMVTSTCFGITLPFSSLGI